MGGAIPSTIVDIFTLIDVEAQNEERNNFYHIVKESEKVNISICAYVALISLRKLIYQRTHKSILKVK